MALSDFFEPFARMVKTINSDEMVGSYATYAEGEQFMCGCSTNNMNPTDVASQQAVKVTFTLFLPNGIALNVGDRVKRLKTGTVLQIVTNSVDMEIPQVSSMNYSVCTAEVVK